MKKFPAAKRGGKRGKEGKKSQGGKTLLLIAPAEKGRGRRGQHTWEKETRVIHVPSLKVKKQAPLKGMEGDVKKSENIRLKTLWR